MAKCYAYYKSATVVCRCVGGSKILKHDNTLDPDLKFK